MGCSKIRKNEMVFQYFLVICKEQEKKKKRKIIFEDLQIEKKLVIVLSENITCCCAKTAACCCASVKVGVLVLFSAESPAPLAVLEAEKEEKMTDIFQPYPIQKK